MLEWNSRVPKYIDAFPRKVSSPNSSSRQTVLANSSTQGRTYKIWWENWKTGVCVCVCVCGEGTGRIVKRGKWELTVMHQDEGFCRSGRETLNISANPSRVRNVVKSKDTHWQGATSLPWMRASFWHQEKLWSSVQLRHTWVWVIIIIIIIITATTTTTTTTTTTNYCY